ncbi:MAG: hypothetical protein KAH16_03595 [Candidatus Izimaplasma sp.]|nr:hypothetical protein [Candidatus Izimaplasma bacterium]
MKVIIFYSMSKKQMSKNIAYQIKGDQFEIVDSKKRIKFPLLRAIYYGFVVISSKRISIKVPQINFSEYDEVVLVSPVWAGRVCPFMKTYLKLNLFKHKKVTIVSSSIGDNDNYFNSYYGLIEKTNVVIKHITYIKGVKTNERKV